MIGFLLIGDEILSAQVEDKNLKYALHHFALSGHKISEVRMVSDSQNAISAALTQLASSCQFVITSGGVGPTHDDCTLLAVSAAFNSPLKRNPLLEKSLREFYGSSITDAALTMADIPEAAELKDISGDNWPIIQVRNCFILPGVPQIFKQKFDRLVQYLPAANPYFISSLYLKCDEVFFAEKLTQISHKFPHVEIGSYPIFGNKDYTVQITLKHKEREKLDDLYSELTSYFQQGNWLIKSSLPQLFTPQISQG